MMDPPSVALTLQEISSMLSKVNSATLHGIDAIPIEVQVDIAKGSLPSWQTVGLPESSVRESRNRVYAAIKNCGYSFPRYRITINLAPANIKKAGTAFDLPIALGLLVSGEILTQEKISSWLVVGELSLDGSLKPIEGALAMTLMAQEKKYKGIILPQSNLREVYLLRDYNIQGAHNIVEVVEYFTGHRLELCLPSGEPSEEPPPSYPLDYQDIRGQDHAKRAMMIAAAGGHNLLMTGTPGADKSMLAERLPTILPPLSFQETLRSTKIYSITPQTRTQNKNNFLLSRRRPFRAPHHTISEVGLAGGRSHPRPGEVSLAHNGGLFLDELAEFKTNVLEVLRQPMENREVTIVRSQAAVTFPASFILVAAMNPCPCGRRYSPKEECYCTPGDLQRYFKKISSPLLDRFDLHVPITAVSYDKLHTPPLGDNSYTMGEKVLCARKRQLTRLKETPYSCNAQLPPSPPREWCPLPPEGEALLSRAIDSLGFSARAYDRILRVSRTIADLENIEKINKEHVAEAIALRHLDKIVF